MELELTLDLWSYGPVEELGSPVQAVEMGPWTQPNWGIRLKVEPMEPVEEVQASGLGAPGGGRGGGICMGDVHRCNTTALIALVDGAAARKSEQKT